MVCTSIALRAEKITGKVATWEGIYYNTIESCRIENDGKRNVFTGTIVGYADNETINIKYQVITDDLYTVHSVTVWYGNNTMAIQLSRDGDKWYDLNNVHLQSLDGCTDIDLSLTPLTNTIPIKRLNLKTGESKIIDAAYLDLMNHEITHVQQKYSRISPQTFRYENISSPFTADLIVDKDGLVIDYPKIWKRIYPGHHDTIITKKTVQTCQEFAEALVSEHRSPEIDSASDIYACLLGNWKMTLVDINEDGTRDNLTGEWYFSRVLEGRAIQDILMAPGRGQHVPDKFKNDYRYGSTIRTFDRGTGKWTIDWFNPVTMTHNELRVRTESGKIIHEGKGTDGSMMRWVFDEITNNSFHWYGDDSTDQGKTWIRQAEFFGERIQ